MKKRVFIGSSGEAMDVCRAAQQELDRDFDVTIWDQGVFRLSHDAIDSLCAELDSSEAGVFVLTPDDLTQSRGNSNLTVRDNVIFELGMFLGRLGPDNTFMLAPDKPAARLPSDLIGITTAHYDAGRFDRQPRAAVGPACTRITQALKSIRPQVFIEPRYRARLDRAATRMSRDLEDLVAERETDPEQQARSLPEWPGSISFNLERAIVHVEVGRIQDYHPVGSRAVIVLPVNEYFDDECISDSSGSLGAFVQHHFKSRVPEFTQEIKVTLDDIPSHKVRRNERQIAGSYGIGEAIYLGNLEPDFRLILASVTTERTMIGLHAEPHFIYAAMEGVIEKMNEHRMNTLVMPVLGSGHGEISLPTSVLFNLLAIRAVLSEDHGRHLKDVRLVVFDGDAPKISSASMHKILSHVTRGSWAQQVSNL